MKKHFILSWLSLILLISVSMVFCVNTIFSSNLSFNSVVKNSVIVNSENNNYNSSENQFVVLDDRQYFLGGKQIETDYANKLISSKSNGFQNYPNIEIPSSYNLVDDYFIKVEDQGRMGLCWAFTGNKTLEVFIAKNFGDYLNFSEAWISLALRSLIDEIGGTPYNIGGGGHHEYYMNVINEKGLVLDADMPYEIVYGMGEDNYNDYFNAYQDYAVKDLVSNINYEWINLTTVVQKQEYWQKMKTYLYEYGPIFTSVRVGGGFLTNTTVDENSPYYNTPYVFGQDDSLKLDHAVTIVGYDDNYVVNDSLGSHNGAWICQNSWGESYSYFYVPYEDCHVNQQSAIISSITYNGYVYDFTKTSQQNFEAYKLQNLVLEDSNTNYSNFNYNQSIIEQNFTKDIFNYTEDVDYKNTLIYSYPSSFDFDNCLISANIIWSNQDITTQFLMTQNYDENQFIIESKNDSLKPGTYNVELFVDKNRDGVVDKTYIKSFVVFSGAQIEYAYTQDLNNDFYYQSVSTSNSSNNVFTSYLSNVDIGGISKKCANLCIEFENYSKIIDYSILFNNQEEKNLYDIYQNNDLSFAQSGQYSSGLLYIGLCKKDGNFAYQPLTLTLRFETLDGYYFDYVWNIIPFNIQETIPVLINYHTDGGGFNNKIIYNATNFLSSSNSTQFDEIFLENPIKSNHIFSGWYFDSDLTNELPKQNNLYYLDFNDFYDSGKNYYVSNGGCNLKSVNIFAKFTPLFNNIEDMNINQNIDCKIINDQNASIEKVYIDEIENVETSSMNKVQVFDVAIQNGYKLKNITINGIVKEIGKDVFELKNLSKQDNNSIKSFYVNSSSLIEVISVITEKTQFQININDNIIGGSAKIGNSINNENSSSLIAKSNANDIAYIKAMPSSNYTFKNWEVTSGSDLIKISNIYDIQTSVSTMLGSNYDVLDSSTIVITPVFQEQNFNITYQGLEDVEQDIIDALLTSYNFQNHQITLPNISKSGALFTGWTYRSSNGDILNTPTRNLSINIGELEGQVSGDLTLTANWDSNGYVLSYSANNGSGSWDDKIIYNLPDEKIVTKGLAIIDESSQTIQGIYRDSYVLSGWNVQAKFAISGGTSSTNIFLQLDTEYFVQDLINRINQEVGVSFVAGDEIILSAVWQEYSFNIVFDVGEGYTLDGISESDLDKNVSASDSVVLYNNQILKNGYKIISWKIINNLGEEISYEAGTSKTASTFAIELDLNNNNQTLTFIAVWSCVDFTITFNFENPYDPNQIFDSIPYSIEDTSIVLPNANNIPEGYHLVWKSLSSLCDFWNNKTFDIGELNFPANSVFENVELIGEIIPNQYQINYITDEDARIINQDELNLINIKINYSNDENFTFASFETLSKIFEKDFYYISGIEVNDVIFEMGENFLIADLVTVAELTQQNNQIIEINVLWTSVSFDIVYYVDFDKGEGYQKIDASLYDLPSTHIYDSQTFLSSISSDDESKEFSGWHLKGNWEILEFLDAKQFTADITLYGEFKTKILTITFYDDNGEYLKHTEIEYGQTYNIEDFIPQKDATVDKTFEFDAWFDGVGVDAQKITDFVIYEDVNYFAHFNEVIRQYTVTFYNDLGEIINSLQIEYGQNALNYKPTENPTRPNTSTNSFTFLGWNTDKLANEPLQECLVNGEIQLYPIFLAVELKYSLWLYDENKSDILISKLSSFSFNSTIDLTEADYIPDISFKNDVQFTYSFIGWFYEDDLTNDYGLTLDKSKKVTSLTIKGDTKLYAQYERKIKSYKINLYYNNFETNSLVEYQISYDMTTTSIINKEYGSSFDIKSIIGETVYPNKEIGYNYDFVGWFNSSSPLESDIPLQSFIVEKDCNIYAVFTKSPIKIIYTFWNDDGSEVARYDFSNLNSLQVPNYNDGYFGKESISIIQSGTQQKPIYIDTYNLSNYQTLANNYIFVGWFDKPITEKDGTEIPITELTFTNIQEEIKLYAWFDEQVRQYEIQFYDANNNAIKLPNQSSSFDYNSTIDLSYFDLTTPTKEQTYQYTYTFSCWCYDKDLKKEIQDNKIVINEDILENGKINLYPKFTEELRIYTIRFYQPNSNELLFETYGYYGGFVEYHGNEPVKQNDNYFSYNFIGWKSDADDSGLINKGEQIPVRAVSSLQNEAENTYRPVFESIAIPYILTLKIDNQTYKEITYTYNSRINFNDSMFKIEKNATNNTRYIFVGWSLNQTANPENTQEILSNLQIQQNTTVFAIFKEVPYVALNDETVTTILIICGIGMVLVLLSVVVTTAVVKKSSMNNSKKTNDKIQEIREKQAMLKKEREELERKINERKNKK